MSPGAIRVAVGALAVLAASLGGCRVGRQIAADPDDYAAYRPTRTRATLEERLRASESYLRAHPDGAFADEVRRAHARAEEALWVSKRGSTAGLRAYLEALPAGPHAGEARRTLAAREAAAVDLLGRRAGETEQRLAAAAAERSRARDEIGLWVRRFADEAVFAGSLGQGPGDLITAWALALPPPRCAPRDDGGRRCSKLIERPFVVPVASGRAPGEGDRALVLDIAVDEDPRGAVCAVTIGGPAAFSRREEAASLAAGDDPATRERAALAAASLVRSTLETRRIDGGRPPPPCVETAAAARAGAIDLACGALRIAVRPGAGPGEDDAVTISRASSCSGP